MKEYIVNKYSKMIDWSIVKPLIINEFPWYDKGLKQETFVQVAICDKVLHIKVKAIDCHSSAEILEDNGSVYLDSCFEFFVTPENNLSESYINFEINCVGNLYLAVRDKCSKRRAVKAELDQVKIRSSLPYKRIKKVSPKDDYWSLDIEIPLKFLETFYGRKIDTQCWYGNFYRIGGKLDDQYGTWNWVETDKPDFHQPLQFGKITLV